MFLRPHARCGTDESNGDMNLQSRKLQSNRSEHIQIAALAPPHPTQGQTCSHPYAPQTPAGSGQSDGLAPLPAPNSPHHPWLSGAESTANPKSWSLKRRELAQSDSPAPLGYDAQAAPFPPGLARLGLHLTGDHGSGQQLWPAYGAELVC